MLQKTLKKIFGSRSDREINRLIPVINEINQIAKDLQEKSDEELKVRTKEIIEEISVKYKVKKGTLMKSLRIAFFGCLSGPDLIESWLLLSERREDLYRIQRCLDII